jgi:hypothetical protein
MHKKYAKDGFVAVSVALDDPTDKDFPKVRGRIQQFLEKQGATFTNLILNEKPEDSQQKLNINGPPCLYVFNRDGHWVKKFPLRDAKGDVIEDGDYTALEKVVDELMKK